MDAEDVGRKIYVDYAGGLQGLRAMRGTEMEDGIDVVSVKVLSPFVLRWT
jgi:hypothetical protein